MNRFKHKCLGCHFFRIALFSRWCAHPNHHKKIRNEYLSCEDWEDMFSKDLKVNRLPFEETLKKAKEIETV